MEMISWAPAPMNASAAKTTFPITGWRATPKFSTGEVTQRCTRLVTSKSTGRPLMSTYAIDSGVPALVGGFLPVTVSWSHGLRTAEAEIWLQPEKVIGITRRIAFCTTVSAGIPESWN
jgi:hypothetical protein